MRGWRGSAAGGDGPRGPRFARIPAGLRRLTDRSADASLELLNRLRLPSASVLPAAGAIVGLYSGLAAGLFANMIGLVGGLFQAPASLLLTLQEARSPLEGLRGLVTGTYWHIEYAIVGVPLGLGALLLARLIEPGGPRDVVKRRLRILGLLALGALALYYPLVALSALNAALGYSSTPSAAIHHLPFWIVLLAPAVGGLVVGRLLKDRPEVHGHGVPEVVRAVQRGREGLPVQSGLLKLLASAITIGSGGSAGREGPIVYGGAAFGSAVGRTLGFSRRELSILLACGAGAGISASFNAPIAGAVFAMEIILRQFEVRVFSPIILACVTGTLVSRGIMGGAPMLERISYQMRSGWEILGYVVLGLLTGLLAYLFIRLLHHSEGFFSGRSRAPLSGWLARRPAFLRAGIGGLLVGVMALLNPTVWGSGHEFVNEAANRELGLTFLLAACALKILATAVTLGSGGSGGTFFPAMVFGAMGGGALGEVVHGLFPTTAVPSGAYAMVGMGGAVAAMTRGPLTGMIMLYELSGNYAIILPLMVTCSIASALCHNLLERRAPKVLSEEDLLAQTPVRVVLRPVAPVPPDLKLRPLVDRLLTSEDGVLPVLDASGHVYGIVQVDQLREIWKDETVHAALVASDLARHAPVISADTDLRSALTLMDLEDLQALPALEGPSGTRVGLVTRGAIRRLLVSEEARRHQEGRGPVAATEIRSR